MTVVVGVVGWVLLTTPEGPRFLSTSEAQRVAISRFQNFNEGTREVSIEVAEPRGKIVGQGYFDYASGSGIVKIESEVGPSALLWWSYDVVGERLIEQTDTPLAELTGLLDDSGEWRFSSRNEAVGSQLGATLVFVAGFGFDRPDNPKLIEQSDAVWLRGGEEGDWVQLPSADVVRSPDVAPVQNPGLPRVLIDEEGGIRKAQLGSEGGHHSKIRFGAAAHPSIKKLDPTLLEGVGSSDDPIDLREAK